MGLRKGALGLTLAALTQVPNCNFDTRKTSNEIVDAIPGENCKAVKDEALRIIEELPNSFECKRRGPSHGGGFYASAKSGVDIDHLNHLSHVKTDKCDEEIKKQELNIHRAAHQIVCHGDEPRHFELESIKKEVLRTH